MTLVTSLQNWQAPCEQGIFTQRLSLSCRPGEGSLLPLWQFKCEKSKKHVTSICWSSLYSDQFAVGYGSFHYQKQGTGAVSVFSLKNPSHAERTITTQSGTGNCSSGVSTCQP
jgi:hypothetical protein